jgi:phage terminase large subunit
MGTRAAHKTVSDGIQATQARMRPAGDGRPRLFLLRDSVIERDPELEEAKHPASTAEEIPGYIWLPAAPGRAAKEQPLKEMDDGCDTMRYMCAARDLVGGAPRVRWLG